MPDQCEQFKNYSFKMLWMETFCFYCSVRLGVILSAGFSIFQAVVVILILALFGSSLFASTKQFIEKNEQHNQDVFILRVIDEISGRPHTYSIVFKGFCAFHVISSALAIYAALKLQKVLLIPYICSQFVQFLTSLGTHIIAMIILKKIVNLGILIGMTLAGGFYLLFLGYSWAGAVGLFQIIILVNSQKYKILYGEDPLAPREKNNILRNDNVFKENDKIVKNNNYNNIYNQPDAGYKRKRLIEDHAPWQYGGRIISVIPVDQQDNDDVELIHFNNWHWNELVGMKKSFK
ncbi:uncharacterized protein LOC129954141 [Eupeodes corollae]|uniref:uncharacterized protein LOC129954141 n=1 Tax=Eupeodes corollae TaxID=290404 RepID=UPI00248FC045|nr:uncharacterized protein LOC129954141 [Eupeodes corollae]